MGKDYYEILGLVKGVTEIEIRQAYKTLAFKFHPECSTMPGAAETFQEAAEAYDVLSDPMKRDIFDKYGEEGLKGENPESGPNSFYKYHGDASSTFAEFIESDHRQHCKKGLPLEYNAYVSLDEVKLGCTKQMTVARKVLQSDGSIRVEEKSLSFIVKPGCSTGTKFIFKGAGNQGPNVIPADVIFVLRDIPDLYRKREGSNVIHTVKLTLKEALCGTIVNVPLLCGGSMSYTLENEVISESTVKTISGQGLPIANDPSRNGDLIIHYEIVFPEHLSKEAKFVLSNISI